jgi:hypothetical protein
MSNLSSARRDDIDDRINVMGIGSLLQNVIEYAQGDDYDGCFTAAGEYEFNRSLERLLDELEEKEVLTIAEKAAISNEWLT